MVEAPMSHAMDDGEGLAASGKKILGIAGKYHHHQPPSDRRKLFAMMFRISLPDFANSGYGSLH
jgi:hypothetical protein